jgi:AraC-like DNA-binding protein
LEAIVEDGCEYHSDITFTAASSAAIPTAQHYRDSQALVLGFVSRGELRLTSAQRYTHVVTSGRVYWFTAASAVATVQASAEYRGVYVVAEGPFVEQAIEAGLVPAHIQSVAPRDALDMQLTLTELVRLAGEGASVHQGERALLLELLLCTINETLSDGGSPASLDERVADHIAYVRRHPTQDHDFCVAAAYVHTSYTNFRRVFGRLAGRAPHDFLLQCRVEAAARALEVTRASIKAIALDHGFRSVSHFSRTFRMRCGHSPSEHRAQRTRGELVSGIRPAVRLDDAARRIAAGIVP